MPENSVRRRIFVALGVVALSAGLWGCGSNEPPPQATPEDDLGTPTTLLLESPVGAVDAGVYASKVSGAALREGLALDVREVDGARDATELLEAGRADAAIMGIDDFGRARENGVGLVGIGAIVQPNPKTLPGEPDTRPEEPYPAVILVTSEDRLERDPETIETLIAVLDEGYSDVIADPEGGLGALLIYKPSLDGDRERTRLDRLLRDGAFVPPLQLDRREVATWIGSAVRRDVLREPIDVEEAFRFDLDG